MADIAILPLGSCLAETGQVGINTSGRLLLDGETIAKIDRGFIQPNPVPTLSLRHSSDYLTQIESLTTPRIIHIELQRDDGMVLRRPLLTIQPERVPEMMEITDLPAVLIDHPIAPTLSGSLYF